MLTGQYGHNNGVLWNDPDPYGDLRSKQNTLPVWLNRAGEAADTRSATTTTRSTRTATRDAIRGRLRVTTAS